MTIAKKLEGSKLCVALSGRLDTLTAQELDGSLKEETDYTDVLFDFAELEYISSAGLRLLFACAKRLGGKEHVVIEHANNVVKEIFRVTGFAAQITIA